MATLQLSTASNAPTIDPTQVDELREFLDEWLIGTGSFDDITLKIAVPERDPDTGEADPPHLTLYGYASFSPTHTEDFLRELSPFLTEPFVIQTVGYEKCRFPHVGYQYRVDPDGEIDHIQLG
jgi:hypothetical protein